jgi:transmembrane sensor
VSTDSARDIDRVASDWIARRDAGLNAADEAELNRWLEESDLHQIAFLRLQRVWEESRRLKALGAGIPRGELPEPGRWVLTPFFDPTVPAESEPARDMSATNRFSWAHWAGWGAAAVVLLSMGIYAFLTTTQLPGRLYSTPVGGVSSLPLADGSRIVLNTSSQVRVELSTAVRRVDLEAGEAFFDVARDPRRPFFVTAGDRRIVVLGTKFSVRRDGNDVEVVVTEGAVQVETPHAQRPVQTDRLVAGTVAHASNAGVLIQRRSPSEVEEALSWRGGLLVFRDQTLADAIAEFNRYTERKIVIVDPRVAGFRVAGTFQSNNAEDFVRLLEQGYPLRVEAQDDKILLRAR